MFRPNALKARLRSGKRALGCWTVLGAPAVIELLALCGFDYLLLDQEHGFGEPSALLHSLQAMAATPHCTSVVRVPSNDANYLKRVLDAGVGQDPRQVRLPHALGEPHAARADPEVRLEERAQPLDLAALVGVG